MIRSPGSGSCAPLVATTARSSDATPRRNEEPGASGHTLMLPSHRRGRRGACYEGHRDARRAFVGCGAGVGAADRLDHRARSSGDWLSGRLHRPRRLLNRKLQSGEVRLEFEERTGYLRSLLAALDVPIESQIVVFSGTSLQSRIINAKNPRTIFFNDSTAVAWMSGGLIEVASLDPRQGAIFYLLPQQATIATPAARARHTLSAVPLLDGDAWRTRLSRAQHPELAERHDHAVAGKLHDGPSKSARQSAGEAGMSQDEAAGTSATRHRRSGAPGRLRSTTQSERDHAGRSVRHAALPLAAQRHRGAAGLRPPDADDESADASRLGSQNRRARAALPTRRRLQHVVDEVVDYMLFVDEAPLDGARGHVGIRRAFRRPGTARRQGAIAARSRSAAQADALPVQLHDLLGCVQCAARRRKRCGVRAAMAGAVRSDPSPKYCAAVGGGSPGDHRDPARHEEGLAERLQRRSTVSDPVTGRPRIRRSSATRTVRR